MKIQSITYLLSISTSYSFKEQAFYVWRYDSWLPVLSGYIHSFFGRQTAGWLLWLVIGLIGIPKSELRAQGSAATPLTLEKLVNKSTANQGDQLTYRVIVTNTGNSSVSNIVVRDSSSTGLRYVSNSAIIPTGTTFTNSSTTSLWTVATLSAGQSLTLTFQAVADSLGILYNRATIPGDTATACTSIPIHVCTGDQYTFRLTAAPGRSSYRWFKDNVEMSGQTSNVLDVTAPGSYSLAIDNVSGRCPDFSCCSFVVVEDALPAYQARAVSADCATPSQPTGKLIVSDFNPAHTYQYSAGTTFTAAASLSGAPKVIPASGILASNLANPASDTPYTIRVYNTADCYIDQTVTLHPAACCSLSLTASAGPCAAATNTFSSTVLVSLTNPSVGTLTVTDGPKSMTFVTTAVSSATFAAVFTDLVSNNTTHTVTVSLPGCSTASTTYTAPVSCLACVNPVVTIANASQTSCAGSSPTPFSGSVVSGTATAYAWYGPLSSTTATLGTAISGQTSATYQPDGNQAPGTYYYALLALGSPASCTTLTFASLTLNPRPNLVQLPVSVCAGQSIDILTSFSVANGPSTSAVYATQADRTNRVNALTSTTVSLSATTTFYVSLTNAAGCSSQRETTISVNPLPSAGANQTLACSNGAAPTSTTLTATGVAGGVWSARPGNPAPVSFSNNNALSTSVAGLTAPGTYTFVFTSPASCSSSVTVMVPSCLCSLALNVAPGACDPQTNRYSLSGTVSLINAPASSLTLTDGQSTTTLSVTAGQSTAAFSLTGLATGSGNHTVTLVSSATTCGSASTTYTAPTSCSAGVALLVAPGLCQTATNQYSLSGTLSLTNAIGGNAIITDGSLGTTVRIDAGATSVPYSLTGLTSGTGSHTITVNYANQTISTTYAAPTSCTVDIALSVTDPGICQPATNSYTTTGIISLTNAVAGTALVTDGTLTTTLSITAGQPSATYSLTGLLSGTGKHTVTVTYAGKTASTTYTAPVSCSVVPCGLSMVLTPSLCLSATNTYTLSGTLTASNVPASGTIVVSSTSFTPQTLLLAPGNSSNAFSYSGLISNGQTYTLSASYSNSACPPVSQTYTAPASCSVAPVCSVSATAKAVPVTCLGATPQANGQLVVSNFTARHTYQYAPGATFDGKASVSGPAQPIPVGGVLVKNMTNPTVAQPYTIRVYDGASCYSDITVSLIPTVCICPASVCVPIMIRRTR